MQDTASTVQEPDMSPELAALKSRLKATWSAGDYGHVAGHLQDSALQFLARIPIEPGTRLLDLACGNGQIAFPAARAGAHATGIDIAPNLIAQARARAEAEGLDVGFDEGDAENLPYADASFDMVFSLIGAMFAPCPPVVAREMLRVCRPGGRIVMGNWTAEGFIGHMFRTVARHVAPPPLLPSPLLWGDEDTVRRRLSGGVSDLQLTRRIYPFAYDASPGQVVDYYREYFGPVNRAFTALDRERQRALHTDLTELWSTHNQATDGTTYVAAEILEVVATRK